MEVFELIKKNRQKIDLPSMQSEQTPDWDEQINLILSERKKAGVRWVILLDGKQVTQYRYFGKKTSYFCVGTAEIGGPDILLNRDYDIYFYVMYDEKGDFYLVSNNFDGPIPIKKYTHGDTFTYGIDSFTLL